MPEPITAERNAYALLTKPTLELTDTEAGVIVDDLRRRRLAYVSDPKKGADKATTAKPVPVSKAEKTSAAQDLLLSLDIELGLA